MPDTNEIRAYSRITVSEKSSKVSGAPVDWNGIVRLPVTREYGQNYYYNFRRYYRTDHTNISAVHDSILTKDANGNRSSVDDVYVIAVHATNTGSAGVGNDYDPTNKSSIDQTSLIGLKVLEVSVSGRVEIPIYPVFVPGGGTEIQTDQQFPPSGGETVPEIQIAVYDRAYIDTSGGSLTPTWTSDEYTVSQSLDQSNHCFGNTPIIENDTGSAIRGEPHSVPSLFQTNYPRQIEDFNHSVTSNFDTSRYDQVDNFDTTVYPYIGEDYCGGFEAGTHLHSLEGSGLGTYPAQGDRFRFYVNLNGATVGGSSDRTISAYFGVQEVQTGGDGRGVKKGYQFKIGGGSRDTVLKKRDGSSVTELDRKNLSVPDEEWIHAEINWQTDGTIIATLYDFSGSQIGVLTGTDTTFFSGGIGFRALNGGSDVSFVDHVRLLPSFTERDIGADGLQIKRVDHPLVSDSANNVYALGGRPNAGGDEGNVAVWDGSTYSTSEPISSLPVEVYSHGAVVDSSDNIYIVGGTDPDGSTARDQFHKWDGSSWNSLTSLPKKLGAISAAIDGNDNIYAVSGFSQDVYKYDGSSWSTLPNLPNQKYRTGAATDEDGNLYVAGGGDQADSVLKEVFRWDGSSWNSLPEMSQARKWSEVTADSQGNIYVISGGEIGTGLLRTVEVWNGSEWCTMNPVMNEARVLTGATVTDSGELYVWGGWDGSFDPVTNFEQILVDRDP